MPLAPGYYVHLMYRLKLWHVVRQQQYWLTLRKRVPTRKPPGKFAKASGVKDKRNHRFARMPLAIAPDGSARRGQKQDPHRVD
jgi:hypothetical protein